MISVKVQCASFDHCSLCRLPDLGANSVLLELGCGPTVHSAVALRNCVQNIYMADYSSQARQMLIEFWQNSPNTFDWTKILHSLQTYEASNQGPAKMIDVTRSKIRGVISCDVNNPRGALGNANEGDNVLLEGQSQPPNQFDIVSTIFCLEYATTSDDEYCLALSNTCKLIKPGGFLAMGAILNENHYTSGFKKYRCHTLTEKQIFALLEKNNFELEDSANYKYVNYDDIVVLLTRKKYV